MSFDIFVQHFQNGETATFERKIAEDIFGPYAIQRDKNGGIMRIKYPDGGGADVYGDKQEQIDHLGFDRFGGDAFFDALLQFANRIQGVIYWPGEGRCSAVTDPSIVAHLPAEFIEGCGQPVLVRDRKDLTDAIRQS